jgi:DNA replication protein DnaC
MVMTEFEYELERIRAEHKSHEPKYFCAKCKDTTWITWTDDEGYPVAKRCSCYTLRQVEEAKARSEIPQEFQEKNFEDFVANDPRLSNAREKARQYAEHFVENEKEKCNSIMLCGQVGAGKTHLATAICNELMTKGIHVTCFYYRNAVTKLKQLVTSHDEYAAEISKFKECRVLFIDDLLKGKVTDADVNVMYEIIDWRYSNKLPVIVSTEKTILEIMKFDEAIAGRLVEMCRENIIRFKGEELDYRLRRQA